MNRLTLGVCMVCLAIVGFVRADVTDEKAPAPPNPRLDFYGDPLPERAVARLGTVKWRVGHSVSCLCFSPDGKTLVSGSTDNAVQLWDVNSGNELRKFEGHAHHVTGVAFSPDGKTLASAGHDEMIHLSEVATGKIIRTLKGHAGIGCLAFSPDGSTLASGSWVGSDSQARLQLWEVATGKDLAFMNHAGHVMSVAFTPDGKHVISANYHDGVRVWEAASGKEHQHLRLDKQHPQEKVGFIRVALSPDGRLIAGGTTGIRSAVVVWDLVSGKQLHHFGGCEGDVLGLAFTRDGKQLVSGYGLNGGTHPPIVVWDLKKGMDVKNLGELRLPVSMLSISPDGKQLAVGLGQVIRIWNTSDYSEHSRIEAHNGSVGKIAVTPDGKMACTTSQDGTARVWDAHTGAPRRQFLGIKGEMPVVAFTDGGKSVVTVTSSNSGSGVEATVQETETGKILRSFDIDGWFWSASLSADGEWLAVEQERKGMALWQVSTGKQIQPQGDIAGVAGPFGVKSRVHRMALSSDGKCIAVGYLSGKGNDLGSTVEVWDTVTGRKLHTRTIPIKYGKEKAVGFQGRLLTNGESLLWMLDEQLHVMQLRSGKTLHRIDYNGNSYLPVTLSSDGSWLALKNEDSLRIIDLKNGKDGQLKGPARYVVSMCYSPDNKHLFTDDGTAVLVWDLTGLKMSDLESFFEKYLWWIVAGGLLLVAFGVRKLLSYLAGRRLLPPDEVSPP